MESRLYALFEKAIEHYGMLENTTGIVVGISGGMDSLVLLLMLSAGNKRKNRNIPLYPAFVDNFNGQNEGHNKRIEKLSDYIKRHTGLDLHVIRVNSIAELTSGNYKSRNTCYLCAQKRRTELIHYAASQKANKIAFGHHMDDILETSLMNLFFKRELSSMVPRLKIFDGEMEFIRPLAYVEKAMIEEFVYTQEEEMPIFSEVCPNSILRRDHKRLQVRELIKKLSNEIPHFRRNLFEAFRRPDTEYLLNYLYQPETSGRFKRP
ncbi:tRNA(Cytosine32)-2-thiocytidine synthetase [Brevinematales bacterium NS]|nr:tRNA(Cytosine32)-2-thiocytidine synthetase [Brevinematales bacterium NS]